MRQQAAMTAVDLLDEDPRVAMVLAEISTGPFGRAPSKRTRTAP